MREVAGLWNRINSNPQADFLVTPAIQATYGDLAGLTRRWLEVFDEEDLEPGNPVLIVTSNEWAAITVFVAALLDGLLPVMLSPETPDGRVLALAATVEPRLLVIDDGRDIAAWGDRAASCRIRRLQSLAPGATRSAAIVDIGLGLPLGGREPRLPREADGLAYLLFTSGTTQDQSGVMITRGNLLANLATLSRLFGYDGRSRIFNDMVLAHADGLVQGPLVAIANGCALIRSGGFTVPGLELWLDRVRQERASHVIAVPTVWSMIDRYAQHEDYFDAPECVALLSVASRLDGTLWRRLESRFRRPVFNQYGLTETVASALYAGSGPEMGAVDSIGRPVDCEARISALESQPSGSGELELRGDNIFLGYWKNEIRTAAAFTDDGWLRTGDLARLRADGSYDMLGRLKTVVMCGGFLIRPEEIDEAMMSHPAVVEAATVALADAEFGEIPVTAVVIDGKVEETALTSHARALLEAHKVPKRVIVLPAIPRGDAGKPRLSDLRATIRDVLGAEAPAEKTKGRSEAAGRVYALAADVLRLDPQSLGPGSGPGTVREWDSFAHIALIVAVEAHFGLRIPVKLAIGMKNLAELIAFVEKAGR